MRATGLLCMTLANDLTLGRDQYTAHAGIGLRQANGLSRQLDRLDHVKLVVVLDLVLGLHRSSSIGAPLEEGMGWILTQSTPAPSGER